MSYSLSTNQTTKAAAVADLMRQFDEQVITQFALHSNDRAAVQGNLNAVLGMLASDDSKSIVASISGFISTTDGVVTTVGISAAASHGAIISVAAAAPVVQTFQALAPAATPTSPV